MVNNMIDEKLITQFIPANVLEHPSNTYPDASFEDKIRLSIRRFISSGSFTGPIIENSPAFFISKCYFDPQKMGYDVILRIL